tara:strand:- start:3057 stop:3731 length:675 start_codon:yes stop_codon:yes gene_type:complete
MDISKLIYDIREATSSISDDRRIDDRYILNTISVARAEYLRQLIARKPYYSVSGLTQTIPVVVETVSRSRSSNLPLQCTIMRSVEKIPKLIYEGTVGNWWNIRTVDILNRWLETIEPERSPHITFEFNVLYGFIDFDYYLYFLSKDTKELEEVFITGVFENPLEVDPGLTEYPIKLDMWNKIMPFVIDRLLRKPKEDPVNNSEPDREENGDVDRRTNRPVISEQ